MQTVQIQSSLIKVISLQFKQHHISHIEKPPCLPSKPGVVSLILGFSSLSDETLTRGHKTIFQDKLLTRTDCDKAGDYVVPNVLSPRDLVSRPDIGHKLYHHHLPYCLIFGCTNCSNLVFFY